jgi:capsular polysaccharide transport system permease protein
MSQVQDLTQTQRSVARLLQSHQAAPQTLAPIPDETKGLRRLLWRSLLIVVVLPSVALFLYLSLLASDQYESTSTFVLRGDVQRSGAGPGGTGGVSAAIGALNRTQEGAMLVKFMPSRAFVERLTARIDVKAIYANSDVDWLSRLPANADAEDMGAYWSRMAHAVVDPLSGVVTLQTRAFSPEEALAINEAALAESEVLLNAMLESSRADALRIATQERRRASEALEALRREIEAFRKETGSLDPSAAGGKALVLIFERRSERVALSGELQSALATLSPAAPQVRALRARLAALDAQIAQLEADLLNGRSDVDLATLISRYDELELKRTFAEETYSRSELTLLRTTAEIDRWQVYLTKISGPDLPTVSVRPTPLATSALFFAAVFIFWSILALIAAGTADRRG